MRAVVAREAMAVLLAGTRHSAVNLEVSVNLHSLNTQGIQAKS